MYLLFVGCEYAGTTTLLNGVVEWTRKTLGNPQPGIHDHFKWPHLNHPDIQKKTQEEMFANWSVGLGPDPTMTGLDAEGQQEMLSMDVKVKEMFQRYHIEYHLREGFFESADHFMVGLHFDEAVYAPLYLDYGYEGIYGDRQHLARIWESHLQQLSPAIVLVHVTASAEVIRQRMKDDPHPNALVKDGDVETVLTRFQQEVEASSISRRITIDTTQKTPLACVAEFDAKIRSLFTQTEKLREKTHKILETA